MDHFDHHTKILTEPGQLPIHEELLASLEAAKAPWAIVTSGTRPLVTGWLDIMKLAHPRNLVVAEDVKEGKPGKSSVGQWLKHCRMGTEVSRS